MWNRLAETTDNHASMRNSADGLSTRMQNWKIQEVPVMSKDAPFIDVSHRILKERDGDIDFKRVSAAKDLSMNENEDQSQTLEKYKMSNA